MDSVTADSASLLQRRGFIDGCWVGASSSAAFPVVDPATGEEIGQVPDLGPADVETAIAAAQSAWSGWRMRPAKERAKLLHAGFDAIVANTGALAQIITPAQGKSLAESRGEVAVGASFVECFGEEGKRVYGDMMPAMRLPREEAFEPVAPVFRFKDEAQVIDYPNDANFELMAYFYSTDVNRIWRVLEELQFGMVGINERLISTEPAPFGGIKERGLGREGSKYSIDEYTELKYACLGGSD